MRPHALGLRTAVGFALALALAACSARREVPLGTDKPLTEAAARGRTVFQRHCDRCHPGGEAGLGPALSNRYFPGFLVKLQVRSGLGAMPDFDERLIDDRSLDDLYEYVSALR